MSQIFPHNELIKLRPIVPITPELLSLASETAAILSAAGVLPQFDNELRVFKLFGP